MSAISARRQGAVDNVLSSQITSAGVSAGLVSSAGKIYYLKDALGSVTDIVSSSGALLQHYEYSAFGKILDIRNGEGNSVAGTPLVRTSYTYTGRELDAEAGLYYYRARYYDANTGRFLQQDPDPGKIADPSSIANRYTYAGGTPTKFTDPSGKVLIDTLLYFAVASFVTSAAEVALGVIKPQDFGASWASGFLTLSAFAFIGYTASGASWGNAFLTSGDAALVGVREGISTSLLNGAIFTAGNALGIPLPKILPAAGLLFLPDLPALGLGHIFYPPLYDVNNPIRIPRT